MTNWMTRWGKRDDAVPDGGSANQRQEATAGGPPEVGAGATATAPSPHFTDSWGSLCEQIANALHGTPIGALKKSGVTVNTLVRAKSGEGIRLETLEKIARYLGWTITITDKEGNPIVRAS